MPGFSGAVKSMQDVPVFSCGQVNEAEPWGGASFPGEYAKNDLLSHLDRD